MKEKITLRKLAKDLGCLAEYDPNAMEYHDAIRWIRQFIEPVKETQITPIRESLGKVLSERLYSGYSNPAYGLTTMILDYDTILNLNF